MTSTNEFPGLDFSVLLDPKCEFAVHFSTNDQALHFIREIRRQHPDHSWFHDCTRWDEADGELAYSPYLNHRQRTMTWDKLSHYVNKGYTILEFEDLLPVETDIEESGMSIEDLFGGAV